MTRLAEGAKGGVKESRSRRGKGTEMIDPYMAGKMADYSRFEIARARGNLNWKRMFNGRSLRFSR